MPGAGIRSHDLWVPSPTFTGVTGLFTRAAGSFTGVVRLMLTRDSFRATVIRFLCLRDFPIVRSGERRPGYIVKFDKWIAEPSLSRTSDGY
jgi:hypothetical protein